MANINKQEDIFYPQSYYPALNIDSRTSASLVESTLPVSDISCSFGFLPCVKKNTVENDCSIQPKANPNTKSLSFCINNCFFDSIKKDSGDIFDIYYCIINNLV